MAKKCQDGNQTQCGSCGKERSPRALALSNRATTHVQTTTKRTQRRHQPIRKFVFVLVVACFFALPPVWGLGLGEKEDDLWREEEEEVMLEDEEGDDWDDFDGDVPHKERMLESDDSADSNEGKTRNRGRVNDCTGFSYSADSKRPPPCRIDSDDLQDGLYQKPQAPPNQLTIGVFLGLRPRRQSIGPLATDILTNMWTRNISNMHFFLTPGYENQHDSSSEEDTRRGGGGVRNPRPNNPNRNDNPNRNNDSTRRNLEEQYQVRPRARTTTRRLEFDMYHTETESDLEAKHRGVRWWWRLNMTFECFWADAEAGPVGDAIMSRIRENMTLSLSKTEERIQTKLQRATKSRALRLRLETLGIPTVAEDQADSKGLPTLAPTEQPSASPASGPQRTDELDAREWDWRKYLGLSLLVATVVIAILLRILGARRQRQREKHQKWGNLGSQEGVDALLNTGWVLKGSQMQIYDKTGVGYSDDDSVFLGGFEQKEAVVGTEVTVTHPETSETPDIARSHLSSKVSSKRSASHLSGSKSGSRTGRSGRR